MRDVYIEAYVPIMRDGRFLGAIETYVDVTEPAKDIDRKTLLALLGLIEVFIVFGTALGIVYARHARCQKQFLESVRASEENHRNLPEFMPFPMFVHLDGKIIYCNVAAMEKFGYDDISELHGKDSRALVYEGNHALMAERRKKRLVEGGASAPEEFRYVRRDSSVFYGETSAASAPPAEAAKGGPSTGDLQGLVDGYSQPLEFTERVKVRGLMLVAEFCERVEREWSVKTLLSYMLTAERSLKE